MKILVHSRATIETIDPQVPYIVITITDKEQAWANVRQNDKCLGVLKMNFHDADKNAKYMPAHLTNFNQDETDLHVFDEEAAKVMIDFVQQHTSAELLICQCDAGISRSSGAAAAFGKILNKDDTFIFDNPRYKPNRTVYRTILETYYLNYAS